MGPGKGGCGPGGLAWPGPWPAAGGGPSSWRQNLALELVAIPLLQIAIAVLADGRSGLGVRVLQWQQVCKAPDRESFRDCVFEPSLITGKTC